ncbi:MAG: hypothetical protein Tsb0034_06010 [Ekhidna sp.]
MNVKRFIPSKFSIGSKIKVSFLVLVAVIALTCIFTFLTLNRSVGQLNTISNEVNPTIQLYGEYRNLIKDAKSYSTNWVYVRSYEKDKQKLQEIHNRRYPTLKAKIDSIIALDNTEDEGLASIQSKFDGIMAEQETIMMTLSSNLDYEDPMSVFICEDLIETSIIPSSDLLIDQLDEIINQKNTKAIEMNAQMQDSFSSLNIAVLILGVLGVMFAVGISFLLTKVIKGPLERLKEKINQLSVGEIPEQTQSITSDEIGEMGAGLNKLIEGFNEWSAFAEKVGRGDLSAAFSPLGEHDVLGHSLLSMRENLKNVIDETNNVILEAGKEGRLETRIDISNKEGAWISLSTAINDLLESIATPILEVNKIVTSMAEGNLTEDFTHESRGDIEKLTSNLSTACIHLSSLLSQIASSAIIMDESSNEMLHASEEMNSTTSEIASSIAQMSSGAQNQVQKVDEASGLVEMILNSANEMESMAEIINTDATNSVTHSQKGSEMIGHVAKSMSDIASFSVKTSESIKVLTERSKEIERVLGVISEIASQTNLLALNAAIEAAQAGEAGRGFAVVAEEIRKLAEDSKQSAMQIEKLITDVQEDTSIASEIMDTMNKSVKDGEEASSQAASVFGQIEESTDRTLKSSEKIFNSTKAQKEAITQVVNITESVVVIAEQTAAGTEEIASSAAELSAGMENYSNKSKELVEIADNLKRGISQFKLREVEADNTSSEK